MKLLLIIVVTTSLSVLFEQNKPKREIDPYEKYVTALPATDRVEILAVKDLFFQKPRPVIDCHRSDVICEGLPKQIVASKTLTGADAIRLSGFWRKLQPGGGAGCFAPAYVLRFYKTNDLLLAANVCFGCCNITIPGIGGDGIVGMCGDKSAIDHFKAMVTTELPFPSL